MKNQQLNQLARSLAAELSAADFPHLWRVSKGRREWWEELTTDDAWLMLQVNNNRLVIASDRPRQMKTAGNAERITASLDRKPEALARDIRSRLLPNAREHFQRCREYTRKCQQDQDDHAKILHDLQPFHRWKQTDSDGTRTSFYSQRTRADIYSNHIHELKIDSPTIEEVIQILTILERK